MMLSKKALSLILVLGYSLSAAVSGANYWQDLGSSAQRSSAPLMVKASEGRLLLGDVQSLQDQLLGIVSANIELPLPNGQTAIYRLEYSPIAEQGLLDKFPEIRTFSGIDIDNPNNRGRFDISPAGFRGMFRHNGETVFIDPQYQDDSKTYLSYYSRNAQPLEARSADQVLYKDLLTSVEATANRPLAKGSSDGRLRTYRLAVAATGEYTAFFGGTVASGLAAITTAINRINEVFEIELGIRLVLVANNNLIIYTNAASDPYLSDGSSDDLDRNQTNIDSVIGSANYDIGHLFGIGLGGIAQLGSVCNPSGKSRGLTGGQFPTGDSFYIDLVAHELGHQFGANHTFNGTVSNCSGSNRNQATAYEVGSGSTIMAYAGICGAENIQGNSDSYFHAGSIEEITRFITTGIYNINGFPVTGFIGSCGVASMPANATPNADAGPDEAIPVNTPFVLTGSATDADAGDSLSYVWEQLDTGTASNGVAQWVDDGSRTIFRSVEPSANPVRYFPNLPQVLTGTSINPGAPFRFSNLPTEALPTNNRTLSFRFTVRDGNGETAFENKQISVTTSAGPFVVNAPVSGSTWSSAAATVTWDVANTNLPPVSCNTVDISLTSNNNGPFTEELGTFPNTGSAVVNAPLIDTSQARVMVACADNVFYAVNDGVFNIVAVAASVDSIGAATANEGDVLRFPVSLSATLSSSEIYSFNIVNVTASNNDTGLVSFTNGVTNNNDGTITVPAGISSFAVEVTTTVDAIAESDETLNLFIGGLSALGVIEDVGSAVAAVTSPVATEGSDLVFVVNLTSATTSIQNFNFSLTSVTASTADYSDLRFSSGVIDNNNGTLSVPVGVLSFTATLTTIDDTLVEGNESVQFSIGGMSNTGIIVDNDSSGGTPTPSPTPTPDTQANNSSNGGGGGGSTGGILFALLMLMTLIARKRCI